MVSRNVAVAVCALVLAMLAGTAPAPDNYDNGSTDIDLVDSQYPGGVPTTWYSPGDPITMRLSNADPTPDGNNDAHDVVLFKGRCNRFILPTCDWSQRISSFDLDDVDLDANTGEFSWTYDGGRTGALTDGDYRMWVAYDDYHTLQQNSRLVRSYDFSVHLYTVTASFDRAAYIPGDTVTVFYKVTAIKDGSLVSDSTYSGKWESASPSGGTLAGGGLLGTEPQGQFTWAIPATGTAGASYSVAIWWNDTLTNGQTRQFTWTGSVWVDGLDATVELRRPGDAAPSSAFPIGSTVQVDVTVTVQGSSTPVEGASVTTTIYLVQGATRTPISGLTDAATTSKDGRTRYFFVVESARFTSGQQYLAEADVFKVTQQVTPKPSASFTVLSPSDVIAVDLVTDRTSYVSGEVMTIQVQAAVPAGSAAPNSYALTITSGAAPNLKTHFSRVQSTGTFTWTTPTDFAGTVTLRADVYNAEGDYGTRTETRDVAFGRLVVNTEPTQFSPGNTLNTTFTFSSGVMTSPTYYYEVRDGSANLVAQGTASPTSGFTFTAPSVPASYYTFTVFAADNGRVVSNADISYLRASYVITLEFDAEYYEPGDVIEVTYTITAQGLDPLPPVLTFLYYVKDQPVYTTQLTTTGNQSSASGTLRYTVPATANEGVIEFTVTEFRTNTRADEVLNLHAPPPSPPPEPAPPVITGMEAVILLIALIALLLALLLLLRKGGGPQVPKPMPLAPSPMASMGPGPSPPPAGPAQAPPPPPGPMPAVAGAGMSIPCRACGKPIEITTSKRPIEVMCPACGNTEIVK